MTHLARVLAYTLAVLVWGIVFGLAAVLYAVGAAFVNDR